MRRSTGSPKPATPVKATPSPTKTVRTTSPVVKPVTPVKKTPEKRPLRVSSPTTAPAPFVRKSLTKSEVETTHTSEELEAQLAELLLPKPDEKPYKPLKGDAVDEALAVYLNEKAKGLISPKAIERVSPGLYNLAKKTKVMIKVINKRIMARIGGGWEELDKFINHFLQLHLSSLRKLKRDVPTDLKASDVIDTKEFQ